MSLRVFSQATITLAVTLLVLCAVQANAQQSPNPQAKSTAVSPKPLSAKTPASKTTTQAAPAPGMVVFVDPATGKIRQPDAEEIGALTGAANNATTSVQSVAPTGPTTFTGPGGSVGMKLGDDSLSYMVVTKTPDGKLAEECVTGDKAASALLSKGVTSKTPAAPNKNQGVLDEK